MQITSDGSCPVRIRYAEGYEKEKNMKIALCEFHQETNSFNPVKTTLADYRKVGIYEGTEMYQLRGRPVAMAGKFAAIEEAGGAEIVPLLSMTAQSGGTVEHEVVDYFLQKVDFYLMRQSLCRAAGIQKARLHCRACGL